MATTNEKLLAGALVAVIVVAAVAAVLITRQVHSTGKINVTGFSIYSDPAATVELPSVDWGNLNPGEVAALTFYAKNTGTTNITLNMNSTAWQPTNAEQFISYSWDYNGQVLVSKQVLSITLYCSVSDDIVNSQPLIETFDSVINMNAVKVTTADLSGAGVLAP